MRDRDLAAELAQVVLADAAAIEETQPLPSVRQIRRDARRLYRGDPHMVALVITDVLATCRDANRLCARRKEGEHTPADERRPDMVPAATFTLRSPEELDQIARSLRSAASDWRFRLLTPVAE